MELLEVDKPPINYEKMDHAPDRSRKLMRHFIYADDLIMLQGLLLSDVLPHCFKPPATVRY